MKKQDEKIIEKARDQAAYAAEQWNDSRMKAVEDLEFVFAEDQWDPAVKNERGQRPCLNSNDLPVFLDRVVAVQRMNRPAGKAVPVDSNTDKEKAEIISGLIRNIEQISDAFVAYDTAIEHAAAGGYCGAIRIITQYENDDVFDEDGEIKLEYKDLNPADAFNQEIRILPVDNPLNLLFDPDAKLWHKNDGKFLFLFEDLSIDRFKEDYPKAKLIDFDTPDTPSSMSSWGNATNKTMRIAEYFVKERLGSSKIYLVMVGNGDIVLTKEPPEDKDTILQEREIEDFKIVWRKISGYEILEGPTDMPGKLWPIIPVWPKELNINGKKLLRGLFRYVKDPQRGYIYTQSAITETLALQPKSPFIGTARMFEGFEEKWRTANTQNWPFLPFNPDDKAPGLMPKRQDPPQIPVGFIEQAQQRQVEKKDVIGIHESSLGKKSNETSGLAIRERKASDDVVTYTFHDNLLRAIKQTWTVIVGMIPKIYDTKRILRILDIDMKTVESKPINQTIRQENGSFNPKEMDLTIGKHDIVMQTGPGYATQRAEALDRLTNIMQYAPNIAATIADVVVDLMEIPRGEKLVKRLEAMLPPQIIAAEKGEGAGIPQDQIPAIIQQAIEEYKQSLENQKEILKVEQQRLKVEQERYQLEQERIKTSAQADNLKMSVKNILSGA